MLPPEDLTEVTEDAAVFTSIMMVAAQNETVAGQVFGVNVAFAVMCVLAAVLFGIAVVKIK